MSLPRLRRAALLCVAVLLAALALAKLDWSGFLAALFQARPGMVAAMMASWFMLLVIRPERLNLILRGVTGARDVRYARTFRANLIAIAANNILPARAGDLLLALILPGTTPSMRKRHVIPALVVERFVDLAITLSVFLGALTLATEAPAWAVQAARFGLSLALISLLVLILVVARRRTAAPLFGRLLRYIGVAQAAEAEQSVLDILHGVAAAARLRTLIPVVLLTLLTWVFTILSYWLGVLAVWPEISLVAAAFTAGAVTLSFVMPISPGGIGVFHAVAAISLKLFGVPVEYGVAFAVIAHGLPFIVSVTLAALSLASSGQGLRGVLHGTKAAR